MKPAQVSSILSSRQVLAPQALEHDRGSPLERLLAFIPLVPQEEVRSRRMQSADRGGMPIANFRLSADEEFDEAEVRNHGRGFHP